MKLAEIIAFAHHDKWDEAGYPNGLKGEEIPLVARICAVLDAFDALTSKRPYKKPWPVERAVDEIRCAAGTQFDTDLTELFMENIPDILEIRGQHIDPAGAGADQPFSFQQDENLGGWEAVSANQPYLGERSKTAHIN